MTAPVFDVLVCQGRMCTARGRDATRKRLAVFVDGESRARVRVGGCFGLCELGPNLVIRRYLSDAELVESADDRLSLTNAANEFVYCAVDPDDATLIVNRHLHDDRDTDAYSRATREKTAPATSEVAARIRALRASRREKAGGVVVSDDAAED